MSQDSKTRAPAADPAPNAARSPEETQTEPAPPRRRGAFRFANKLERRIVRKVGQAVGDYRLIDPDDELLVAVSGGKDSLTLLRVLQQLRRRAPVHFSLRAVTLDQGYPPQTLQRIRDQVAEAGVEHHVEPVPMEQILRQSLTPGSSPCGLCSRIRRGALYTLASRFGCTKLALGHHLDDLLETLLMNLFYSGTLRSMAPRLLSDDGRNTVIRPLCYVPEQWIVEYSRQCRLPVISCSGEICGVYDTTRQQTKALVRRLAGEIHGLRGNMLRALKNVRGEHLLDPRLLRTPPL